jgi:Nif-specific regulatory protein
VEVGAASPQVFDLQEGTPVQLGRNRQNTIVMQDQHASRQHAEIVSRENRWFIIDTGTTNGTRVNGVKVQKPTPLENNALIAIGDTRIRFSLDPSKEATAELPIVPEVLEATSPGTNGEGSSQTTTLHPDEMTALLAFVNRSQVESTLHGLVQMALGTILRQTCANVVGFLSLDAEDPQFRIVLPDETPVDAHLSKHLMQRVLKDRRRIWLGETRVREVESESLLSFRDALCIPLRAQMGPDNGAEPELLGALHVYKTNQMFREREVCFCELLAGSLANSLQNLRWRRILEADNSRLREQMGASQDILIGSSPAMQQMRQQIAKFAAMPCTVLIFGESGVGKELVSLSLHKHSQRKGPLVTLNCAAIPSTLVESELFGVEKGAYTDARDKRPGAFLMAEEGTLFLDEIGEMALPDQAKLLRVLDSKRLRPVGGTEVKVDVRVITATNRDLEREMREGTFRKDLYFRLGPVLRVPPLREHLEDIPELVQHFLARLNAEYRRPGTRVRLSESALERLQTYTWPGNVRQLRSVLETAVAMSEGNVIHAGDLHLIDESTPPSEQPTSLNLEALEAWAIRQALAQTNDNNVQAAKLLGIHRDTLIAKRKKYNIVRDSA